MVKLKRLKINKYRNVRPGTELRFDDGFNLVLGQNGSGKTTLLGLIAAVTGNDFERLADEYFCIEYEISTESGTVVIFLENKFVPSPTGAPDYSFSYHITIEDFKTRRTTTVSGTPEKTEIIDAGLIGHSRRPFSPFRREFGVALMASAALFINNAAVGAFLTQRHSPYRFDEALDSFLAMTGRVSTTPGVESPKTTEVKIFLFDELPNSTTRSASIEFDDYFPHRMIFTLDISLRNARSPIELNESSATGPARAAVDLLATATTLLGFKHVSLRPNVKSESKSREAKGRLVHVEGFTFDFTRIDGSVIHHDLLSFGQKRLISFFYYLACNDSYVIADELVNGLHHRWIEACMDAIGDRQAFLTSQNPLLFDYIPDFESVEQVQSRFITCKTELVEGTEQLVWQNMPHEHARIFFEAYKDEVEQVGEILIARGLW